MKKPCYWTCFGFENIQPHIQHCTHKFLGFQHKDSLKDISDLLDTYFALNPIAPFRATFNKEDFFGFYKNLRVLRPADESPFLFPLKQQLDAFRKDDFPVYQPHLTPKGSKYITSLSFNVNAYYLMEDENILKTFAFKTPNPQNPQSN